MKFSEVVDAISSGENAVIKPLARLAAVCIGLMSVLVVINIIGRLLGKPLLGTVELVELIMVIVAFFGMAHTAAGRGHVSVDLLSSRFPKRFQKVMTSIAFFLGAVIFGFMTYQASVNAVYLTRHIDESTTVLFIPYAPFRWVMALGCLLFTLRMLVDVFRPLPPEEGQKED